MKKFKKLMALLFAVLMAIAVSVPAFAATGSITIIPPEDTAADHENEYKIYKVFDAEGDGTAITYKLVTGKTTAPAGFTVDAAGNVTYSGDGTDGQLTNADIDAIAEYVKKDTPVSTKKTTGATPAVVSGLPNGYYYIATATGSVVAIDSANPDVTVNDKHVDPTVDKKITGTSDDAVFEPASWTDAQIGDTINYTITALVPASANKDVVLRDTMDLGLSLKLGETAFTVKNGETAIPQTETVDDVTRTNWYIQYSSDPAKLAVTGEGAQPGVSATTAGAAGTKLQDADSFVVIFTEDYVKTLTADTTLTVSYYAVLNENAKVYCDASPGYQDYLIPEKNKVRLDYSNYSTPYSETEVYSTRLDIVKYTHLGVPMSAHLMYDYTTHGPGNYDTAVLNDVTFKVYRDTEVENGSLKNGAKPLEFVAGGSVSSADHCDGSYTAYAVYDGLTDKTHFSEINTGVFRIVGLDVGDYYLEEVKAPAGYNKVAGLIKITVVEKPEADKTKIRNIKIDDDEEIDAEADVFKEQNDWSSDYQEKDWYQEYYEKYKEVKDSISDASYDYYRYGGDGVGVLNEHGAVLPSTGSIGTTVFYVIGAVLLIGAGVLLVTRRRMKAER